MLFSFSLAQFHFFLVSSYFDFLKLVAFFVKYLSIYYNHVLVSFSSFPFFSKSLIFIKVKDTKFLVNWLQISAVQADADRAFSPHFLLPCFTSRSCCITLSLPLSLSTSLPLFLSSSLPLSLFLFLSVSLPLWHFSVSLSLCHPPSSPLSIPRHTPHLTDVKF